MNLRALLSAACMAAALVVFAPAARAQTPVFLCTWTATPTGQNCIPNQNFGGAVTTTQSSVTISVTNTFQVALGYSNQRHGGFIQNTGTAFQYIFFAGNAASCSSAAKTASIQLQPPSGTTQGGSITLQVGETSIQDTICVTGTANDTLVVGAQ